MVGCDELKSVSDPWRGSLSDAVRPDFKALSDDLALPSGVLGPVECCAFRRLAVICLSVDMEKAPFAVDFGRMICANEEGSARAQGGMEDREGDLRGRAAERLDH
jgi:hypothetical protein